IARKRNGSRDQPIDRGITRWSAVGDRESRSRRYLLRSTASAGGRAGMSSSVSATVFVVDDDPEMRAAMQRLLKTVGLHAEAFASAKDFLQRNLPEGPSCLILDIRLPGMSGLDVQRKLAEAGTRIPVIFITAHADVPLAVKAMKSGAVDFLTQPIRGQDLVDAVPQAIPRAVPTDREHSNISASQSP